MIQGMAQPDVLISGGGIAGTVFAWWLLRAYKHAKITIVERAPALRLTGASVDIRSSAVDIIKWMGVEPEIRKHSTQEEGIQYVDANGKAIGTLKATGHSDVQSITSEYEIFRGALAKIFVDPILPRVKILLNESISSYEHSTDGKFVNVTFANSKETKMYDLLIAADGMGSRIRGMMLNSSPYDQVHDEGVHVAYFTINKDLLDGSRLAQWYNTTGGRCIFLRPDPSGVTRGNLMNITWKSNTAMREKLNRALRESNTSYLHLMEDLFRDAGWKAPEVLRGMRESDDFYCSLFAQVRSPKLFDGRVVLLGDSGYAVPGFGTSLAIMGGYVLAGEILRSKNFDVALKRYEELMLPFAKSHQSDDIAMQLLNPQTSWGLTLRNIALKTVTGLRLDRLAMVGAAKLGFTEKKLAMPDYPWPANEGLSDQ